MADNSMSLNIIIVTSFVTVPASIVPAASTAAAVATSIASKPTLPFSSSSVVPTASTKHTMGSAPTTSSTASSPSHEYPTGTITIPSQFATPIPSHASCPSQNVFPHLALVLLILVALLYLLFLILAFILYFRKRCPNCVATEAKLKTIAQRLPTETSVRPPEEAEKQHEGLTVQGRLARGRGAVWNVALRKFKAIFHKCPGKQISKSSEPATSLAEDLEQGQPENWETQNLSGDRRFTTYSTLSPLRISSREDTLRPVHLEAQTPDVRDPTPLLPPINLSHPTPPTKVHVENVTSVPPNSNPFSREYAPSADRDVEHCMYISLYDTVEPANPYAASSIYSADTNQGARPMEVLPAEDPDTEAYRRAAAQAADVDNPDRYTSQMYANRLLKGIRARERKRRTGGYGGFGDN